MAELESEYTQLEKIGEGTFGRVYKASHVLTDGRIEYVAVKKLRMENETEGFPVTAIREIRILKELLHPNIVRLIEVVASEKDGVRMVYEYAEHDLAGLMATAGAWFVPAQIKCYAKQILAALDYIHANGVIHRDLKASNILITGEGVLKLADFGLARTCTESGRYTNKVITMWYRPPELLLGATSYGAAIDMWSFGCILAELCTMRPLFPGPTEKQQLELIFKWCGTPCENGWRPDALPLWSVLRPLRPVKRRLSEVLSKLSQQAFGLVDAALTLDPEKRVTARQALDSDYFWTYPYPLEPSALPKYPPAHDWVVQSKNRIQQHHASPAAKRAKQ